MISGIMRRDSDGCYRLDFTGLDDVRTKATSAIFIPDASLVELELRVGCTIRCVNICTYIENEEVHWVVLAL
jgi:hypothetical protein